MFSKDKTIKTRPVRPDERYMQERFSEAIAGQSIALTTLAQQLLVVELAIPGLYAAILKLISGHEKIILTWPLGMTFACWLIAIVCTIAAMIPRRHTAVQRNSPDSIEAFFDRAAAYKRIWLIVSIGAFVLGIFFVIWDLLK